MECYSRHWSAHTRPIKCQPHAFDWTAFWLPGPFHDCVCWPYFYSAHLPVAGTRITWKQRPCTCTVAPPCTQPAASTTPSGHHSPHSTMRHPSHTTFKHRATPQTKLAHTTTQDTTPQDTTGHHRTPQDTTGHHRTPQDTTGHHTTVAGALCWHMHATIYSAPLTDWSLWRCLVTHKPQQQESHSTTSGS
jgi:hypothetical protein